MSTASAKIIPIVQQKHPQRLRYSTLETLYTCERKFQLDNLLMGSDRREESEHLSFGTAFGVGIAHYLIYQDRDEALFAAWLAYWPQIESDKKNEEIMLSAMMNAFSKCDDLLEDYEVLSYNGKPAAELTFRLDIDEDYYFTGAIDIVLKHRYTGVHYIVDVKTTGLAMEDVSPLYGNSSQTLGYSIALDAMTGEALTSYGVMYFVAQLGRTKGQSKIHVLTFEKTILDRLNWFLTLAMDCKRLKEMEEYGVYPKRGGSCLHYMRPCKYWGTCGLHSLDIKKEPEKDETVYDLNYRIDDLVQDHIKRVERMETLL